MMIPSIDIRQGNAVQLANGRDLKINAGDPLAIAQKFSMISPMAVIDLDAATGQGDNAKTIHELVRRHDCIVGGGIRSAEAAHRWLDTGASAVILGTAARPEILRQIPRDRVIAALDAVEGRVVVDGWKTYTGATVEERIVELRELVGGFLFTFVESEGLLQGTNMERAQKLTELAKPARVTIAGGVTTAAEIAALDKMGADAQVGMALYTGSLTLTDALLAVLHSDRPDGLFPTVICDTENKALGLAYSSRESLQSAVESRRGVYFSRKRGLWEKGATSGDHQELVRIDVDCDRDTLRFTVRQHGKGFCHVGRRSCWNQDAGLGALERVLRQRLAENDSASYTRKLFDDADLLGAKLLEEAGELAEAVKKGTKEDVTWESADLLYFTMAAMARSGVPMEDALKELDRRRGARRNQRQDDGEKT